MSGLGGFLTVEAQLAAGSPPVVRHHETVSFGLAFGGLRTKRRPASTGPERHVDHERWRNLLVKRSTDTGVFGPVSPACPRPCWEVPAWRPESPQQSNSLTRRFRACEWKRPSTARMTEKKRKNDRNHPPTCGVAPERRWSLAHDA